jgi:hypothetical protein
MRSLLVVAVGVFAVIHGFVQREFAEIAIGVFLIFLPFLYSKFRSRLPRQPGREFVDPSLPEFSEEYDAGDHGGYSDGGASGDGGGGGSGQE